MADGIDKRVTQAVDNLEKEVKDVTKFNSVLKEIRSSKDNLVNLSEKVHAELEEFISTKNDIERVSKTIDNKLVGIEKQISSGIDTIYKDANNHQKDLDSSLRTRLEKFNIDISTKLKTEIDNLNTETSRTLKKQSKSIKDMEENLEFMKKGVKKNNIIIYILLTTIAAMILATVYLFST